VDLIWLTIVGSNYHYSNHARLILPCYTACVGHDVPTLQFNVFRHRSNCLTNSQIPEDILRSSKDRIKWNSAVIMFYKSPHACLGNSTSTKYLDGFRRVSWAVRVACIFSKAMGPANFEACSLYDMLFIWCVKLSSQLCTLSTREIIAASLLRTTACEWRGLPNALR